MSIAGFAWECSCGNIKYGEFQPEECDNCNKIGRFIKLPEEILKDRGIDELNLSIKTVQSVKSNKKFNIGKRRVRK